MTKVLSDGQVAELVGRFHGPVTLNGDIVRTIASATITALAAGVDVEALAYGVCSLAHLFGEKCIYCERIADAIRLALASHSARPHPVASLGVEDQKRLDWLLAGTDTTRPMMEQVWIKWGALSLYSRAAIDAAMEQDASRIAGAEGDGRG